MTADIVTKLKHNVDIRAEGSGKPGTRNMGRVYGKGYLFHLYKIKTTYLYVVFIRLWRKSSPQPIFVSEPLFMCQH
ncbi:conserved domain protein (plasmid) [Bacillus anthracis str. A0488]|nr:conserved domain protein [Bacillus anthracis str. CDC 684]ACQ51124.1 conserved domain protein [Bacillus anthracis str. A0248]EDR16406.1 conserved domain protein [Bacillus anthracis str. A0488]EDR90632.1 conserved domain protein [Bacillus anthracis str. A0442]EDS94531.1 conserved domain protein [Bacillus anthracis str. A0389]EDT64839.1 conserved domain protein [Bacillus anthracis str. A0174]